MFFIKSDDMWVLLIVRFAMTFVDRPVCQGLKGWLLALLIAIIYAMITARI
jgi:hypothetical protein